MIKIDTILYIIGIIIISSFVFFEMIENIKNRKNKDTMKVSFF